MYQIYYYETPLGKNPFTDWLIDLDTPVRQKVNMRIARLKLGNFGECKSIGDGILETKIDCGPGYRIYFHIIKTDELLILFAGTKRAQQRDIEKAKQYLKDFKDESKKDAKKSYDDFLLESLKNPKEAAAYLNAALEECKHGDPESQELLLMAFKNVAMAQGGFKELSEKTNLGRESLYKTLSKKGNPKLTTLTALVNAMGFDLKISISGKR